MTRPRDLRRWRRAPTLGDLGQLTAEWLEGSVDCHPGYPGGGPDEETAPIAGTLAAANRAGFVTIDSQPAVDEAVDGYRWLQKASVTGLAHKLDARLLADVARHWGLHVVHHGPARWRTSGEGVRVVTTRDGVTITSAGHHLSWRSRVAAMGGRSVVGISARNRAAAGIALGDDVETTLELDTEPRVVAEPVDLAGALDADPLAREAFDRLPYGLRRKHVTLVEDAKNAGTRQRRINRLIATLRGS